MSLMTYGYQDYMIMSRPGDRPPANYYYYDFAAQQREQRKAQEEAKRIQKVNLIKHCWRGIQARRRLTRLRINREIEHLPGRGIKYLEALERFNLDLKTYCH